MILLDLSGKSILSRLAADIIKCQRHHNSDTDKMDDNRIDEAAGKFH